MGRLRAEEEDQDEEEDVNDDDDDDSDNSDDGDMDQDDDCKFVRFSKITILALCAMYIVFMLTYPDHTPTGGFLLSDASGSDNDGDFDGEVDDDIMDALNAISSDEADDDDDDEGGGDQDNDSWEDISVEEENL